MSRQGRLPKSARFIIASALLAVFSILASMSLSKWPFTKREQGHRDAPRITDEAPPVSLVKEDTPPSVEEPSTTESRRIASEMKEQDPVRAEMTDSGDKAEVAPASETRVEERLQSEPGRTIEAAEPGNGLVNDFWIWAGAGVNFTSYSQTIPGISAVNFGRIKSLSQVLRAGFFFGDRYGLDLGYKMTPGKAESGSTITVRHEDYQWKTLSAEAIYRPRGSEGKSRSEWLWRVGAQQHEMPFIVPLAADNVEISTNSMTALSAGIEYRKLTEKNIRLETMIRYQHPVASASGFGSSFRLSPQFTFDGSVGAAYAVKPNLFLGIYWYGQYHSYKFDYTDNSISFSGNQKLFYSNFDLRLGVEF